MVSVLPRCLFQHFRFNRSHCAVHVHANRRSVPLFTCICVSITRPIPRRDFSPALDIYREAIDSCIKHTEHLREMRSTMISPRIIRGYTSVYIDFPFERSYEKRARARKKIQNTGETGHDCLVKFTRRQETTNVSKECYIVLQMVRVTRHAKIAIYAPA